MLSRSSGGRLWTVDLLSPDRLSAYILGKGTNKKGGEYQAAWLMQRGLAGHAQFGTLIGWFSCLFFSRNGEKKKGVWLDVRVQTWGRRCCMCLLIDRSYSYAYSINE